MFIYFKQFGQCVRDIRTLSKLSDFSLKLNCNLVNDLEARETLLHPCPLSSAFAEKFNSHFRLWYSNGWFLVCHPPLAAGCPFFDKCLLVGRLCTGVWFDWWCHLSLHSILFSSRCLWDLWLLKVQEKCNVWLKVLIFRIKIVTISRFCCFSGGKTNDMQQRSLMISNQRIRNRINALVSITGVRS